jgi:hypothetical protein
MGVNKVKEIKKVVHPKSNLKMKYFFIQTQESRFKIFWNINIKPESPTFNLWLVGYKVWTTLVS